MYFEICLTAIWGCEIAWEKEMLKAASNSDLDFDELQDIHERS